jgi:hypothetical protein
LRTRTHNTNTMLRALCARSELLSLLLMTLSLSALMLHSHQSLASDQTQDWLKFQRTQITSRLTQLRFSHLDFEDDAQVRVEQARDLRMLISNAELFSSTQLEIAKDASESDAAAWFDRLTMASQQEQFSYHVQSECVKNESLNQYECESIRKDRQQSNPNAQIVVLAPRSAPTQTIEIAHEALNKGDEAPTDGPIASHIIGTKTSQDLAEGPLTNVVKNVGTVKLKSGVAGIVTVDGGKIKAPVQESAISIVMPESIRQNFVSMFVRDPSILTIDPKFHTFKAVQEGRTEIFVVSKDRISIIPVVIGQPEAKAAITNIAAKTEKPQTKGPASLSDNLELPKSLASVDALDVAANASQQNLSDQTKEIATDHSTTVKGLDDLSVPDQITSVGELDKSSVKFVHAKSKASFNKMYVRLIDDRSNWNLTQVYPVGGVTIRLVGADYETITDSTGVAEIPDIPTGSRIFAEVIDQTGTYMPAFLELVADAQTTLRRTPQIAMMRRFLSLDYAARFARTVQNMELGSYCGSVVDTSSKRQPLTGVQVTSSESAMGPFYFNDLGFIDTKLGATASSGRFCFFNVAPGPNTLGVYSPRYEDTKKGGLRLVGYESQAALIMTARGRHTEDVIPLYDARHITTSVASIATASEQLSSKEDLSNRYTPVDDCEVAPIGYKDPMIPIDDGVYTSTTPVIPSKGRIWTISNSSDFESSIQASSIKLPGHRQITSLIPRGFIDDMSQYAQTTQENEKGVIFVEHAAVAGQGNDSVKIRLVDMSGHDAGEGWYYADKPIAKAVFFNVPPGLYSVVVETSNGHWLAADTAIAYEDTSTYVRTGAPLEKHIAIESAQN